MITIRPANAGAFNLFSDYSKDVLGLTAQDLLDVAAWVEEHREALGEVFHIDTTPDHSDSSEHSWWYPEESDEQYPEDLPLRQFERSGDILEFARHAQDDAQKLISKYEDAEVTEIVATPEHEVAEWQATFADGHTVLFWIDETNVTILNRVQIVERRQGDG